MMSDSRISGEKNWDYGPKIFNIGRGDSLIAFAGDTLWTYPLIAQITSYVESFINLREGIVDFMDVYRQVLEILNDSRSFISSPVTPEARIPDCTFILAGYSARRKNFVIRRIIFHTKRHRFEGVHAQSYGGELMSFIGDKKPVSAFLRGVSMLLKEREIKRQRLGMMPAISFVKVLQDNQFRDIGGAPQVAKIFDHMNQRHFGVYWPPNVPNDEQNIYARGRRLKSYEVLDHPWVYDPSTARLYWHDFSPAERRSLTIKQENRIIDSPS